MRTLIVLATVAISAAPSLAQETVLDTLNQLNETSGGPPLAEVQGVFDILYATSCPKYPDAPSEDSQSFDIRFRYEWDDADQPDRLYSLYQFFCYAGVYNAAYVFFAWDAVEGLRPLALPIPITDVEYEGESEDAPVKRLAVIGYSARTVLFNASYDSETRTILSGGLWRGVGDASSGGTWVFRNAEFVLQDYEVDATYDGETNPKTIIDYRKPHLVK